MFDVFHTLFRFKEKESPDELGAFPVKVHVNAFPERRYLWASRFLVILAGLSICFNVILVLSIYLMVPSIKVKPSFFRINEYFNQIEVVEPREIKFPVSDLISEQYIQQYIYLRYTITPDVEENIERWNTESLLYWYSMPQVYSEFRETEVFENIRQFKNGLQRYVEIEWIRPLLRGLWQIQFKTYDLLPDKEPVIVYWRATMRVIYAKIDFQDKEDIEMNPFGFLVSSYSLAYHGTEGDKESYMEKARRQSRNQEK